jgi:hypothetical protein
VSIPYPHAAIVKNGFAWSFLFLSARLGRGHRRGGDFLKLNIFEVGPKVETD